jgi:hypothetical protein
LGTGGSREVDIEGKVVSRARSFRNRELIEEIRLVPKHGDLEIELYGELAALINLANGHPPLQRNGGANNAG